jgi:hypothetical protein
LATIVVLKKYEPDEVLGDIRETEKRLLLSLNAGVAIKLKSIGFDVYASLDSEATQMWISNLITDQESVVAIANVLWPKEVELAEYLDSDGINEVREAFMRELVNFSNPHSRQGLETWISQQKRTAQEVGEKAEREMSKVLDDLRQRMLDEIPDGDALVEKANQMLKENQSQLPPEMRGKELIELSQS